MKLSTAINKARRVYVTANIANCGVPNSQPATDSQERCDCKHGCLNFAIPGENYCHDCGYAVWWEHDTTHGKPHG